MSPGHGDGAPGKEPRTSATRRQTKNDTTATRPPSRVDRHLQIVDDRTPIRLRVDRFEATVPKHLDERAAAHLLLPSPYRPLLLHLEHCTGWTDEGLDVLGLRLLCRRVEMTPHPTRLDLLLTDAGARYRKAMGS